MSFQWDLVCWYQLGTFWKTRVQEKSRGRLYKNVFFFSIFQCFTNPYLIRASRCFILPFARKMVLWSLCIHTRFIPTSDTHSSCFSCFHLLQNFFELILVMLWLGLSKSLTLVPGLPAITDALSSLSRNKPS